MTKIIDAPQDSEAWLQSRVGKITASRFKDARDRLKPAKGETVGKPSGKCTAYAAQVAVERIAGRPIDRMFENWQMREGSEQEPHARKAYDLETGNIVAEVGAIATDDDLFLYSPDGLIGEDGLLEIKTLLSADRIIKIIGEGDLSDFMDQCLGGLWLTGRKWIDLVLWAPALEPIGRQLTIHRITRDENAIEALEADLIAFAAMVQTNEGLLRKGEALAGGDAQAREGAQAPTPAPTPAPAPVASPAPVSQAPAPSTVVQMQRPTAAPAPAAPATLTLGAICHRCGHIWRPADVPTNGVLETKTRGAKDSFTSMLGTPKTAATFDEFFDREYPNVEDRQGRFRNSNGYQLCWRGWEAATVRAASICRGVNNHDNPMTANDCADEIEKGLEP